jgi:hypothetical protein
MSKIIGLHGQAASGKDTCCIFLQKYFKGLNENYKRLAFADKVKEIFCDTFGVNLEFVEKWKRSPEIPPGFLKPIRKCLTDIGDGFRLMKGDVWIDYIIRQAATPSIITDGRYKNEGTAVKNKKGVNIILHRPGFENETDNLSELTMGNIVKQLNSKEFYSGIIPQELKDLFDLQDYDYLFRNDGDLKKFEQDVVLYLIPFIRPLVDY